MRCLERFGNAESDLHRGDYRDEFWSEIHKRLLYLQGTGILSPQARPTTPADDSMAFLAECPDESFLDFIELVFSLEFYWKAVREENSLVDEINHFFEIDDLPYSLTRFVRERRVEDRFGRPTEVYVLTERPRVIRRDSQVMHSHAIEPALELLAYKQFTSANSEFLEALEDYRKRDYDDCLTKCASSLESTLKLVCTAKGWAYQQTDTASRLVQTVIANSTLDAYFEQPLIVIATLRNRMSASHGAGALHRKVPQHRAQFAINATASAILLVVQECT